MRWAPIASLELDEGRQPDIITLEDCTVIWKRGNNEIMQKMVLPSPVDVAVFAYFDASKHIVAVCKDMMHSFNIAHGGLSTAMCLPFTPSSVLGSKAGLVLGDANGELYFMNGPQVLLGTIGPSSLHRLAGDMVFFDDGIAVIFNGTAHEAQLYTSRVIPLSSTGSLGSWTTATNSHLNRVHNGSMQTRKSYSGGVWDAMIGSGSSPSTGTTTSPVISSTPTSFGDITLPHQNQAAYLPKEERAVILTRLGVIDLLDNVTAKDLDIIVQHRQSDMCVAIRDTANGILHFMSGGVLRKRENVTSLAPLKGYLDGLYPMVITNDTVWSLFFPQVEALHIPEFDTSAKIVVRDSVNNSRNTNTFLVQDRQNLSIEKYLFISGEQGTNPLSDCIRLAGIIQGPPVAAAWLSEWTAMLFESESEKSEDSDWELFVDVVLKWQAHITLQYITCLRLLRGEYSLGAHSAKHMDMIDSLLARLEVKTDFPNIYTVLESLLESTSLPYPKMDMIEDEAADIFPLTKSALAFFEVLGSRQHTVVAMRDLFDRLSLTDRLSQFAPGIELIMREVAAFISYVPVTCAHEPLHNQTVAADGIKVSDWLFNQDKRLDSVQRLLDSSQPRRANINKPVNISEHEWAEYQEEAAHSCGEMVYSCSFGKAALEIASAHPTLINPLKPAPVDFSVNIRELGVFLKPADIVSPWGEFCHGAAAGISVPSPSNGSKENRAWTIDVKSISDAGMLYGLGLMGHLGRLEEWYIYEYLDPKNTFMSTGVLLGLAASKRGTMDAKMTKVLSVHISALLPPGSQDLQIVPEIQNAAVIALGLLYYKTSHRRMSDVLQRELLNNRQAEEYRLACGVAIGLIGCNEMCDKLLPLLAQAQDKPSRCDEDTSGGIGGANIALLLLFAGTNNRAVAQSLRVPRTYAAAQYMRPDLLFGMTLARTLCMWDSCGKTAEWALSQIPSQLLRGQDISKIDFNDGMWHLYALTGVLVGMALRHVSTNDPEVLNTVLMFAEELESAVPDDFKTFINRAAGITLWKLHCALLLAASAVAAGSGDLNVLRRLRMRFQPRPWGMVLSESECSLDEYAAVALAMGWLFMGGGQWSFKQDPKSVAILSLAFIPLFGSSGINAETWQHIRHFWVFAAEKRCIIVRDNNEDGKLLKGVKLQVEMASTHESYELISPGLLPSLGDIANITVCDDRYIELRSDWRENLELFVETRVLDKTIGQLMAQRDRSKASPSLDRKYALLNRMAMFPRNNEDLWNLRLLFFFCDIWMPDEDLDTLSRRQIEKLKATILLLLSKDKKALENDKRMETDVTLK